MLTDELPEEEKDAVLAEIGYTRKQLDSDLEHMKDWLKLQHHLPPSRLTESPNFLKHFLTGCKGSLEKAKLKLDAYYTFRSHSEVFDCRDPLDPDYVNINYLIHYAPIPKLAKYTRVAVLKLADVDQEKFEFLSFVRYVLDGGELGLRYERNYGLNFCLIFDMKGISVSNHVTKFKPLLLRDMVYYSMFYIFGIGFEEVSQYFDKSVLPSDYGGDLPPMKELSDFWRDFKIERRDWFLNELSERCDESKRIVTENPTNPYFGVPGSLKKLVVD